MPFEIPLGETLAAVLTLAGAFIGVFLTNKFHRNRDRLELKRDVLRRLMGYRWQLGRDPKDTGGHIYTALNEISVVFAGDERVALAFDYFRKNPRKTFETKYFSPLARTMAESARISHKQLNDEVIGTPLGPPD